MANTYISDALIGLVPSTAFIPLPLLPMMPSVQPLFAPNDFLSILNWELMNTVVPEIDKQAEEYFVYNFDVPYIQANLTYTIPYRALGNRIREMVFVDSTGQEVRSPRLQPEQTTASFDSRGQTLPPFVFGFFFQNDKMKMYFNNSTGAVAYPTLRTKIIRQPNMLVLSSAAAQVSMISGNAITVTNVPTNFTTSLLYDFISNTPPFISRQDDTTCTNISSLTMTFSSVPSDLQVGDWICAAGQSPVPQIPVSAINYLLQCGACKCLEMHGDIPGLAAAQNAQEKLRNNLIAVITPRADGNVIKLSGNDGVWDCA